LGISRLHGNIIFFINVDWYFSLHWLERARAAKDMGFVVHVITNFTAPEHREHFELIGFKCYHIPIKRNTFNPFNAFKVILHLNKLFIKLSPRIVHCITVKPNIFGGLVSRLYGIPCILSVTGRGAVFSGRSFSSQIARPIVKALYRMVSRHKKVRFIFENGDDYDFFFKNKIINADQGIVIKGAGVDTRIFGFRDQSNNQPPTVLFAARLLKGKGLEDLVSAVKILRERKIEFILNVAGILDTDCVEAIPEQQILRWEKEGILNWLGQREDMPSLLAETDIVALPTTYGEGVPRILIEGASVGRPLVATDVVGCREIVIHRVNGMLVQPNNAISLADAIEELIMQPLLRQEMGRKGRQLVENEFAQEAVIEKTIAFYHDLLVEP